MPRKNHLSKEALAFIIEDIGDEILSCFSPDEIASRLSVDERLTGLSAEEVLSRFSPEERVAGLSPEERRQLQQLLEKVNRQPEN